MITAPCISTRAETLARLRHAIVPASIAHVHALARAMRADDAAEAIVLGFDPRKLLRASFRFSLYARTAYVDGEIAAMFGLAGDVLSDVGHPWLITTAAIERLPITFFLAARAEVAAMLTLKARLENQVAAGYARAVHFLEVLGFTIESPAPLGKNGAPFRRFWMAR